MIIVQQVFEDVYDIQPMSPGVNLEGRQVHKSEMPAWIAYAIAVLNLHGDGIDVVGVGIRINSNRWELADHCTSVPSGENTLNCLDV